MTRPRARGFTLIEVLVALIIVGLGIASIIVAYSASLRLMRQARDRSVAALLARSKLEETLATGNADIGGDEQDERYNGTPYAYRITSTPIMLVSRDLDKQTPGLPHLEEIKVDVFWGELKKQRKYTLTSFRQIVPPATAQGNGQNAAQQNAAPASAAQPAF